MGQSEQLPAHLREPRYVVDEARHTVHLVQASNRRPKDTE